jgi:pimeloyl-ACP methyl ester carboxylesterase
VKTWKRAAGWTVAAVACLLAVLLLWPETKAGPTGGWLRAAGLEERYETIDGFRVRYVRSGSGPAVVLLHGFASSIFTWKDVLPGLTTDRTVVAFDFPGFGGSDQPPDLAFDAYPGVVRGLMDRLGLAHATLVGNSMGGAVATVIAAESPERVDALVLIDSAGFNLAASDRPFLLRLAATGPGRALFERLPIRGRILRVGLRQVFHDPALVTEERFDEYLAPFQRPGATTAILSLLASRSLNPGLVAGLAPKVQAPTLVLWGREDAWIPVEQADRFVAAIKGARKVVVEGCGHVPQEERPAEVLRLLREFIEGAGSRSSAP